MEMSFLKEAEPARLVPLAVRPGISRIVAPNPGPMTYHGTNTWLIEGDDGLTVIDPGPDNAAHLNAILQAGPIVRILLTHTHPDHLAGAPALQAATGAAIHGLAKTLGTGFYRLMSLWKMARASGRLRRSIRPAMPPTISVSRCPTEFCFPATTSCHGRPASSRCRMATWPPIWTACACCSSGATPSISVATARRSKTPRAWCAPCCCTRTAREYAVMSALDQSPRTAEDLVDLLYGKLAPDLLRPSRPRSPRPPEQISQRRQGGSARGGLDQGLIQSSLKQLQAAFSVMFSEPSRSASLGARTWRGNIQAQVAHLRYRRAGFDERRCAGQHVAPQQLGLFLGDLAGILETIQLVQHRQRLGDQIQRSSNLRSR